MEKEMKKLLLVAVSVGVFLLVTVTVAIIVISPKQETILTSSVQGGSQPAVNVNIPEQPPVVTNPIEIDNTINNDSNIVVINGGDRNNGDSLTIQIPQPPASTETPVASTVRPAATAPVTTTPSTTTTRSSAQTTTTTATTTRTTSRTINDYWIQIGAYSAMVRAEDTREVLASKGLVSIIENREINGQNLFRVRLGPYTTEREANHWLAIVQSIDGFHESQVRQTVRQQ